MVKSDLINQLSVRFPKYYKKDIQVIVDTIFETMQKSLSEDKRVEIRGFGTFNPRMRKSRISKNPKTGTVMELKAGKTVLFKMGRELKKSLAK
jgi:integration host factor subunit beta